MTMRAVAAPKPEAREEQLINPTANSCHERALSSCERVLRL
jgi:hypothetical protein